MDEDASPTEVDLGPSHIVLDGVPLPTKRVVPPPQFSAYFYCGQTAGWIKMILGTDVGLVPRRIVLDGDPAPPQTRDTAALNFW